MTKTNQDSTTTKEKPLTQKQKVVNIENTVGKNNVRLGIARHVEQYLYYMQGKEKMPAEMRVGTLAAEQWYFEKLLDNCLHHSFLLKNAPKLSFVSAESDKEIAEQSFINMPDNATVLHGSFSDIFTKPYAIAKGGYGYFTGSAKSDTMDYKYGLIWADYCAYPSTKLLTDLEHMITHNIDKGLFYVTYCLSHVHNRHKKAVKDLGKYSKAKDIEQITRDAVDHFIGTIKGKKVKKIFEVIYGGGGKEGTTMITIGFSVNIPAQAITPLSFDDGEWKSDDRQKRQGIVYRRLSKKGGWKLSKKGRPIKRKKTALTAEDVRLFNAVTRWELKWDKQSKEKKHLIADKYGVSMQSFACMVACRHGKHADRRAKV